VGDWLFLFAMTGLYENSFTCCLKKEIIVGRNNRYYENQRLKNVGTLNMITEHKIKYDVHVLVGKIIRECIVTEKNIKWTQIKPRPATF
jgi:hypothetical protein